MSAWGNLVEQRLARRNSYIPTVEEVAYVQKQVAKNLTNIEKEIERNISVLNNPNSVVNKVKAINILCKFYRQLVFFIYKNLKEHSIRTLTKFGYDDIIKKRIKDLDAKILDGVPNFDSLYNLNWTKKDYFKFSDNYKSDTKSDTKIKTTWKSFWLLYNSDDSILKNQPGCLMSILEKFLPEGTNATIRWGAATGWMAKPKIVISRDDGTQLAFIDGTEPKKDGLKQLYDVLKQIGIPEEPKKAGKRTVRRVKRTRRSTTRRAN